ncbi:hypothetical protein BH10PSE16_BH10PSE16_38180 [soil metagenome]
MYDDSPRLIFFDQAENKTDNCHDSEEEEENFGNFNGTCCNSTKAEDGSNQGDYQKND